MELDNSSSIPYSPPMRSPVHACLTLLAFVAMLWAQVFGLHRGFVCDCGDAQEVTQTDHCHGPHSSDCHDHEEESPCHQDHDDDADTNEHAALIERLVAGNGTEMVAVPAPLVSAIEMPVWLAVEPVLLEVSAADASPLRDETVRQRSWPEVLARTIALRI
jgi:hypothetical protein